LWKTENGIANRCRTAVGLVPDLDPDAAADRPANPDPGAVPTGAPVPRARAKASQNPVLPPAKNPALKNARAPPAKKSKNANPNLQKNNKPTNIYQ